MEDRTFAQAIGDLNKKTEKETTVEVIRCWMALQQGTTVTAATAYLKNDNLREAVTHILFYTLLHSALYDAKQHTLISQTRYEELKNYIDGLANLAKQQTFTIPSP